MEEVRKLVGMQADTGSALFIEVGLVEETFITADSAAQFVLEHQTQIEDGLSALDYEGRYLLQAGFAEAWLSLGVYREEILITLENDLPKEKDDDAVFAILGPIFPQFCGTIRTPSRIFSVPCSQSFNTETITLSRSPSPQISKSAPTTKSEHEENSQESEGSASLTEDVQAQLTGNERKMKPVTSRYDEHAATFLSHKDLDLPQDVGDPPGNTSTIAGIRFNTSRNLIASPKLRTSIFPMVRGVSAIRSSTGLPQVGSNPTGIPGIGAAAFVVEEIAKSCNEFRLAKKRGKQITNKCTQLFVALEEQSSTLVGSALQEKADEVSAFFETILNRVRRISRMNRAMTLWKSEEIRANLDLCNQELDMAMDKYKLSAVAQIHANQIEEAAMARAERAELKDIVYQLLANKSNDLQQVQEMQAAGTPIAQVLMERGQAELRSLKEHESVLDDNDHAESHTVATERSESLSPVPPDKERYLEYQRGLIQLHKMTGIPPSIKILNGEVKKEGDLAVAGGVYSDIWYGKWLGFQKVALKALRDIKASNPKAQKRFEREIHVWSELENRHILALFGIVTDLGQHIHTVSPWQDNGNVLIYVKKNPNADRVHLCSGAAQGLEYLHERGVIHGNVKCTNILVSTDGEACICDFGMSKVVEDVTEKSASATLTTFGSARWMAPELIEGAEASPTFATDTYSFAMSILELMTEAQPFAEIRREQSAIRAIIERRAPQRPIVCHWVTDRTWALLTACWQSPSSKRPTMKQVSATLQGIEGGQMDTVDEAIEIS